MVHEYYAASSYGVMDLTAGFPGLPLRTGRRNSHDKFFRLPITCGLRVFVCENLAFHGDFTPVLAKHSKNFSIEESFAIGATQLRAAQTPG